MPRVHADYALPCWHLLLLCGTQDKLAVQCPGI